MDDQQKEHGTFRSRTAGVRHVGQTQGILSGSAMTGTRLVSMQMTQVHLHYTFFKYL